MSQSWLSIPRDSPFSLANIPFGIISTKDDSSPRPAVAIGNNVLDLKAFVAGDGFSGLPSIAQHLGVFSQPTLNSFAALGRPVHRQVRSYLAQVFQADGQFASVLEKNASLQQQSLLPTSAVQNHLPLSIGDYTDFYAGLNHAYNIGVMFRGADNALQPNYKHLPVGYHGRASSVVVSGTDIRRPRGQILLDPTAAVKTPTFHDCKKLDIELELAAFVCKPSNLGTPISITESEDYIFGLVLMNDWSARDIQAWEYVPLGPFTSKNFGTTISPWVVLYDALEPFRASSNFQQSRDDVLPYLRESRNDTVHDIKFQVDLRPAGSDTFETISTGNARDLLYSFPQLLAHHTITGCNMNAGDLLGSGTISGTAANTVGSFIEATKNGKEALVLESGEKRTFLNDGDTVTITGLAGSEGQYVGFGSCTGTILPALKE